MKNFAIAIAMLLFIAKAYTQPVINASWVIDTGLHIPVTPFDGVSGSLNAGSGGANHTWNLTSLARLNNGEIDFVDLNTSGSAAGFPQANVCNYSILPAEPTYEFYKADNNVFAYCGYVNINHNDFLNYHNPLDMMHFPVHYNDNFFDIATYDGLYYGGFTTSVWGKVTASVTVDGYGTLKTGAGTFSNVLRIKSVQNVYDTLSGNGTATQYNSVTQYIWVSPLIPGVILAAVTNSELTYDNGYYARVTPVTTGVDDDAINNSSALTIYQIANSNTLLLTCADNGLGNNGTMDIYQVNGAKVYSRDIAILPGQSKIVNLPGLAAGMYFVQVNMGDNTMVQKVVLQ